MDDICIVERTGEQAGNVWKSKPCAVYLAIDPFFKVVFNAVRELRWLRLFGQFLLFA